MIKGDRISGLLLLLFSMFAAFESYRLGVGKIASPLAGFMPFTASVVLGILSLILLYSTRNKNGRITNEHEDISFNKHSIPKVIFTIVSLTLYAIFLNTLGYLIVSAILMALMLGVVQPQKWYVTVIGSIFIPILSYYLFDVLLKVQLPTGLLGM